MLKDAKQTGFKLLRVDGGASQNNLLMQLQADAIQVPNAAFNLSILPRSYLQPHRLHWKAWSAT